jgi:hypothetical protein
MSFVEVDRGFWLHPTSILDVYKVFFGTLICYEQAYMSTLIPLRMCRLGEDFGDVWVDLSPCNVKMSLLRLKPAVECNRHPHDMYTKCFSILICWGLTCGSTLTVLGLCRSGVDFKVFGVDLSPFNVKMSLLRLQQASDWIPHPY